MLNAFHAIHILLWILFGTFIARSRVLIHVIENALVGISQSQRKLLSPIASILGGGLAFLILRAFWIGHQQHVETNPSSVFALFLVYMFSSYVFVFLGVSTEPTQRRLACIWLTVLLWFCLSLLIFLSDLHLEPSEFYFYYLYYSIAGGISIAAGLLVYVSVIRGVEPSHIVSEPGFDMEPAEIRAVFLKVLTEALESAANLGHVDFNPASAIEEAIPDFYKNRKNPGNEVPLALYNLVDHWANSVYSGLPHPIGPKPPISVDEAKELLEIAVQTLRVNEPITDPRILRWAEL